MRKNKKNIIDGDISFISIINYYVSNFRKIILYALIPILLFFVIFAFNSQLNFTKKDITYANLLVKEGLLENISKTFLFNAVHIADAVENSNLSEKIIINEKLIKSFDIISGHTDLNILVNDYINRDFLNLTKQLYFKPEEVANLRKDLVEQSNGFKIITFTNSNTNLTSAEKSILISNLVDVINESIQIEYDLSNINLKKIEPLQMNNPISSMDVAKINNRLALVRTYLNILENSYSSFAPEINLKVYLNDLNGNEDLFNYVIQKNPIYKDIIIKKLELDIEALNKNIAALKEKMNKFDSSDIAMGIEIDQAPEQTSISADSSFIDTILDLGDKASSSTQRMKYLDDIFNLESSKTSIERRLDDLQYTTNFGLPLDEAEKYLINSLNQTTRVLNEYIEIVKNIKQNTDALSLLSYASPIEPLFLSNIRTISIILIGSICFSLLIVTFGLLRRNL